MEADEREDLDFTQQFLTFEGDWTELTFFKLPIGILQVEIGPPTATQADIRVRLGQAVVRLAVGQVRVIMVLVNHDTGARYIDHRPFLQAGVEEHPIVPAGPANGKLGYIREACSREDEEVTSCWWVQAPVCIQLVHQAHLPAWVKNQRVLYLQVPALADDEELRHLAEDLPGDGEQAGGEQNIGVGICQQG